MKNFTPLHRYAHAIPILDKPLLKNIARIPVPMPTLLMIVSLDGINQPSHTKIRTNTITRYDEIKKTEKMKDAKASQLQIIQKQYEYEYTYTYNYK